ncbi:DHH family phosphoesterase [Wenjunlia tyrosinilytica]|uniref:Phosphoesterase n=1 Tax=Wenjunlia tyrosinilytica TaxID=1544741 RepID=A0A917ZV81_9ACTN|nr:DHH family phosphoesterase [Wenjunlia tyrosinilytica]GGO93551.1 phosphoesterase [Wenjunlia tyrosinilytica]
MAGDPAGRPPAVDPAVEPAADSAVDEAAAPAPRRARAAIPEHAWETAVKLVGAAREVHLVCHVSPDGDALGSALAAGLALRSLGVDAFVSFGDDPQVVPASLSFLPGQDLLIPAAEVPDAPELVVVFDVASEHRLGLLCDKALAARELIVIDHHSSNNGFGSCRLIDPAAPATAVLADELLRRLGVPLTHDIAVCLYTGVATDTGSFKYTATTPATHELAARLLATGIRQDLISRQLWDTASFGYLKVLAAALERARLEPEAAGGRGLVWTVVPHADRERHGVAMDEVEGLIDVVRKAAEAEVALVLKEGEDGSFYGSSRAKGAVDLGAVCAGLGGGGHAYAAGFTSYDDAATTVERFRTLLENELRD